MTFCQTCQGARFPRDMVTSYGGPLCHCGWMEAPVQKAPAKTFIVGTFDQMKRERDEAVGALKRILAEPDESFSNAKALAAIVRIAKTTLAKIEGDAHERSETSGAGRAGCAGLHL